MMYLPNWFILVASVVMMVAVTGFSASGQAQDLPEIDKLPSNKELPDPLVMQNGTRITTREQWQTKRKPELKALFAHYMYGTMPPAPKIVATVRSVNDKFLDGKATLKQISITFGPAECPPIEMLLVTPHQRANNAPPPVFLGLNFGGNHTVLAEPSIALAKGWLRPGTGVENNRATEAGRGKSVEVWSVERIIERGYAVATFHSGDVAPDRPDFNGGVFPHFPINGRAERAADDWGVIAAWAWGLHRGIDYLVTDKDVDARRIILFGHSRNGKAALLAAALDDRAAAVIPHQAGCGGSAPSRNRNPLGETVTVINKNFPHWFNDIFPQFNGREDKLPFDQNGLVALCAPRPVLFSNGSRDQWADPPGQFDVLRAAIPVYRLLGAQGMADNVTEPPMAKLIGSELRYYVRDAAHLVDRPYWEVFMDFADQTVGTRK